jgi:hypothetical protein
MEMAMFPHIKVQIDGYFPSYPGAVTDPVTVPRLYDVLCTLLSLHKEQLTNAF